MPQSSLTTPIGTLHIFADSGVLTAITIGAAHPDAPDDPVTREAAAQLAAWFAKRLTRFDLPLLPPRTPRGDALRAAVQAIEYGRTASYGDVARVIGSHPRAIGQACARNPFPIVVPCHRVVAAGGAIGHYSAGAGIDTKYRLLDHERSKDSIDGQLYPDRHVGA